MSLHHPAPAGARPALVERPSIEISGLDIDQIAGEVWGLLLASDAPIARSPHGKLLIYRQYGGYEPADLIALRGEVSRYAKFFRNGRIQLKPADPLIRWMLKNAPIEQLPIVGEE